MSNAKATGAESTFITIVGVVLIVVYYRIDVGYDPVDYFFYGEVGHIFFGILCSLIAYAKNRNPVIWGALGIWFVLASLIVLAFFKKLSDTECPFCREGIETKAIICPHCQNDLLDKELLEKSAEQDNTKKSLSYEEWGIVVLMVILLLLFGLIMLNN
jgi:hypothetical protein|tara:strand:- start:346 stop:819 length:474 start_codon:yes stop_codon:yes gene_type:complete